MSVIAAAPGPSPTGARWPRDIPAGKIRALVVDHDRLDRGDHRHGVERRKVRPWLPKRRKHLRQRARQDGPDLVPRVLSGDLVGFHGLPALAVEQLRLRQELLRLGVKGWRGAPALVEPPLR